jgi:hypothetical protein
MNIICNNRLFFVEDGDNGDSGAAVWSSKKEMLFSSSSKLIKSAQPDYHDAMLSADTTTMVGPDNRRPGNDVSYENHHAHPRFDYPITTDTVMAHFF